MIRKFRPTIDPLDSICLLSAILPNPGQEAAAPVQKAVAPITITVNVVSPAVFNSLQNTSDYVLGGHPAKVGELADGTAQLYVRSDMMPANGPADLEFQDATGTYFGIGPNRLEVFNETVHHGYLWNGTYTYDPSQDESYQLLEAPSGLPQTTTASVDAPHTYFGSFDADYSV